MVNNIKNIYDFLQSKIGFHKNFSKLINNFFYEENKRIKDDNYRKSIVELILNNKYIIKDSTKIFIIVFNDILGDNSIETIREADDLINGNNNIFFEIIEKTLNNNFDNKIVLEQILLNLFESYFSVFFETIPKLNEEDLKIYYKNYFDSDKKNETFIMLDFSLEMLKNKLLNLEKIYYNNNNKLKKEIDYIYGNFKYTNIIKLYSISYVKIYLYKAIYFILIKRQEFIYFEDEIMKVIKGESLNDFRKIIKIYILKLLYNNFNNYQKLQEFHYYNYGFKFIDEFKEELIENNNEILNYYFIPKNENFIKYEECLEKFDTIIEDNFCSNIIVLDKFVKMDNIDIFYSISVNKILSIKDKNELIYSKFTPFVKNVFSKNNSYSENFKKLLFLLLDEHRFNSIIRPKILLNKKESNVLIDYHLFEIILYSMRFCLQTLSNNNHKNLYVQLINENCTDKIKKLYLPGIDESNNIIINNYYLLEDHLKTKSSNYGAYICSCGTYYEIPPCGFPIESYNCLNCKELIGGQEKKPEEKGYHKMIIRDGHFRIFKNIEDKIKEFNFFKDTDELIPNMLLSEYKEKIIEPLLKNKSCGISKIDKITFIQKNKKIRNLSQVGYRLLNFILYSHLFFSDCLGYINNDFKEAYLYDNMSYLEIIKNNWELLKDALFNKGITIIQIFLNLIFDKISNLLRKCQEITSLEERNKFENLIEKVLEESYKEYEEYSKLYLQINSKLHNVNNEKLKSIILELYNPEEYPENKYPFLKYFIYTKYPTQEHFINELYKIPNYNNLYPLITSYINPENDKIELLKYLPKYNNFVNFMINKYSYKISRNEAYEKKLNNEDIYKNNENNFKQLFKDFIDVWKEIGKYCTQYKCHIMEEIILHEKIPLSQFLIDDGEVGKGMYLAAGYTKFIEWQNNFLEPITKALDINKKGVLYYFNKNLKSRIDVQKANDNDIVKKDFPDSSYYINFLHLISLNSYRNIYYKINNAEINDTKINYLNYNNFVYDFNIIEEELGKIILTGKRLFNTDSLKFITYCYEGFRGEKSSTLIDFIELYPPKELEEQEKQSLLEFIIEKNSYNEYDFTQLMFSIQLIIYYLTQEKKPIDSTVDCIIKSLPEYLNISDDCKDFFKKFYKFKIEKLFEIFSFVELFSFDIISKHLKDDYKIKLENEKIKKIKEYFKNGVEKIIDDFNLASACRKLISRYLISKRNDNDINPENLLFLYLAKIDLWNLNIIKNNKEIFEMELNIIKDFKIKVNQVYELCLMLDPDNILLNEIKLKIEENNKKTKQKNSQTYNQTTQKKIKKKKPKF